MIRIAISSGPVLLAALLVSAPLAIGCGVGDDQRAARARAAQWTAIERERTALEDLRGRLAAARVEGPVAAARELEAEVGASTDRFLSRLVAYINEHAGARGSGEAARAPELVQAIRIKSAEDLLLAREYIDRGGDYAKAIDILESARAVDPGNLEIETALADAERSRYVDEERFSRIEKGMTEDEVRGELGQVKAQNIRRSEDGDVIAWLYPRERGAAAAVFFRRPVGDGPLEVHDVDFDAVPPAAESAERSEGGEESAAN